MHANNNRLISIDIEPGGRTTPLATIGIAEIVGRSILSEFQVECLSPLFPAADEYGHLKEQTPFKECWPYLDAFIGDSPLTAYGHGYDMSALRRMFSVVGIDNPGYDFIDGRTTLRKFRGANSATDLQTVALTLLLSDEESNEKRRVWRADPSKCNKIILHNAKDDAVANARIFTDLIFPDSGTDAATITSYPGISIRTM